MRLEEYIEKRRISLQTFAKESKVSYTTLTNLINKGRDVRISILIKIEEETKGMCNVYDLYDHYIRNKVKKKIELES